jgi:hypothetical protein
MKQKIRNKTRHKKLVYEKIQEDDGDEKIKITNAK